MDAQQIRATLTLALMAAFADGMKDDREREAVKKVADALGGESDIDLPALFRDVLLSKPDLATVVAPLNTAELKQYAYEMAVGVANSDGAQNDAEKAFLAKLAAALQLPEEQATRTWAGAAEVASAGSEAPASATQGTIQGKPSLTPAEYDKLILDASIMNAALELLPESLASMAIIPLQMKMVYRLGKTYGYELDRGHIRDFLATAGVGMASQCVEQIGVKLIGRVFGRGLVGGLLGGLAGQAVSSGFSFATTYALGQLARRYYAGGRTFSSAVLKDTYTALLGEARAMQGQYLPAIREKARTINVGQILQEVRQ